MLNIQRFVVNMIEENCYVLWDDSREAVVIDCGAFYPEEKKAIQDFIDTHELRVERLLQTHAHFDHLFGADFLYQTYGVRPEMHRNEADTYTNAARQARLFMHRDLPLTLPPAGPCFDDDSRLTFGHHVLQVIATPGHTPGGVCFYDSAETVLFSGDSLFRHEIGRCDLPGGNEASLVGSLRERILALPDGVTVCPGHGDTTTVGEERRANPYLQ